MAEVQHRDIQTAECHEPKHFTTAAISDAGKVLTPSAVTPGTSELRNLTLSELGAGEIHAGAFTLTDENIPSKKARFDLSLVTPAVTRVITIPDLSFTLVGTTSTQELTNKRVTPRVVALVDNASVASSADTTDVATVTLAGNRTLSNPSGTPRNGQRITYRVRQDATGSRTLVYGSAFRFPGGTPPVLTTAPGKTDYLEFIYTTADAKWDLINIRQNF